MQEPSPGPAQVSPSTYHDASSPVNVGHCNNQIDAAGARMVGAPGVVDPQTQAQFESDKRSVYNHPLFPLLALLFEKCEIATRSAEVPSTESFNVDIQAFVQHQERDRKPIFVDDPDVDSLMVKAIQVLRIHLLELEKVQELCKDFCNRYIACLKNKMHSENLLRSEYPCLSNSAASSPSSSCSSTGGSSQQMDQEPVMQSNGNVNNLVIQPNVPQNSLSVATLSPGQIVSGSTVYQMVQTPQGLVAQPIQVTAAHVIHGSTPLSQIGSRLTPISQDNTLNSSAPRSPSSQSEDDDDVMGKKKQKRGVLPKHATSIMRSWLFQHIVHPYPTEDEKRQIAAQTNLTLLQVNNWFINARRRILQPMLDASNPDASHKAKKTKTQSSRPVQRFWPENIASLQPQTGPQGEQSGESSSNPNNGQDHIDGISNSDHGSLEMKYNMSSSSPVPLDSDSCESETASIGDRCSNQPTHTNGTDESRSN